MLICMNQLNRAIMKSFIAYETWVAMDLTNGTVKSVLIELLIEFGI